MIDKAESLVRSLSSHIMLDNVIHIRSMITRIRQKEGGIGSIEDEIALHRIIHDLDLLIVIVDKLKLLYNEVRLEHDAMLKKLSDG